jgi:hypothetical protein
MSERFLIGEKVPGDNRFDALTASFTATSFSGYFFSSVLSVDFE